MTLFIQDFNNLSSLHYLFSQIDNWCLSHIFQSKNILLERYVNILKKKTDEQIDNENEGQVNGKVSKSDIN